MADFSLSFDSDNPFAEPEAAPKTAPAAVSESDAPAAGPAPTAPEVVTENVDSFPESAFSLSAFDFTFDDGASINDNLPTQAYPEGQDAPRAKTPGEAAFADFDFGAPEAQESVAQIEPQFLEEEEDFFDEPQFDATEIRESQAVAPEVVESEVVEPEIEVPEISAPEFATPEFAVRETVAPELVEPEIELLNRLDKKAPSDLDEFNALAFDLNTPAGEILAEDSTPEQNFADADIADDMADMFALQPAEVSADKNTNDEIFIVDPVVIEPGRAVAEAEAEAETEVVAMPWVDTSEEVADEQKIKTDARPHRTQRLLNVAILGASGIGKNHARWFHHNGCHISAFLGTSGDSTARTEADLTEDFAFEGKAYTDLTELLANEKPDIVCVATPPELHFAHVLQSLEAGAHVLCEKPLVYAPTRKFRENRDGAKELVKVAAKRNLVLGTQLQYGAATPILCKLSGLSPTDVGDFAMELETLNPNAPLEPRELWIDLGPHPVSVAQMLAGPGAKLAEETIRFEPFQNDDKTEVLVRFGINCADGRLLMSRVVVRALRNAQRQPRRRFSFNGHSVTYAPLNNGNGNFRAQFVAPDGYASVYSDPVDYLIGDFVRACREQSSPMISGDFGRENLEWMLKVAGEN